MATIVFWCAAIYVTVAGFYSITKQVFWPERAHGWDVGCAEGIEDLESELLGRTSAVVAGGGATHDVAATRVWLRDWDARHAALEDRCTGSAATAHDTLATLRHRTEMLLERFEREQAPLVREIDRGVRGSTPD